MSDYDDNIEAIAIVGLSVRVPGAKTADEYWRNICSKTESITWFDQQQLHAAGVPRGLYADPAYVPAAGVLPDADCFDAEFFGMGQIEATTLDPQHRLFLECAWEAMEDSGHVPKRFDGTIGIYGGCFMNRYLANLYTNEAFVRSPMVHYARHYNDKDFMTGHAAYLLDLHGPAITIQTACSTSLVATHLACQSLLSHDCDMALAGGVSVNVPLSAGYLASDGAMFTREGRCRPFDAAASGTLPGSGGVLVALRRLSDAIADGDNIRAVIRGTAVNNDGRNKASFTAPNPAAQMQVIVSAHSVAGVRSDTIGYVEAHATGTPLGDPIEVAALTEAFRHSSSRKNFCAIGSVKANIGHLDAAAGTAGLVRAVLALERKCIPPQANFAVPNPELNLDSSPFYVPTEAREWKTDGTPRRAAVSSFAVGGTNAHAVLEEAPARRERKVRQRSHQLFVMSARDAKAVATVADRLADHVGESADQNLTDVAYTLATGRAELGARRAVVAPDRASLVRSLKESGPVVTSEHQDPKVVFMFPGVGTQYPDMALDIYDSEPVFRDAIDTCATLVLDRFGMDLRQYLFGSRFPDAKPDRESVPHVMAAIFAVEYSLAQLWMSWGVKPHAMLGHSLGEYVAACVAGVLSLPDAITLTVRRGKIFDNIPEGRMMVVPLPEDELVPLLGERLFLGAVNAPGLCLASGRLADLEALCATLAARGIKCRILPVRMASHSGLVDPYLRQFVDTVSEYKLSPPQIPYMSCLTGDWIQAEQATNPTYWAQQLRSPVQFGKMVRGVLSTPEVVLLEVGPGTTLTQLASAQRLTSLPYATASLRHPDDPRPDFECLLSAVGRLWQAKVPLDWNKVLGVAQPQRVSLPTYPFQRKRHWIDRGRAIGPGSLDDDSPDAANSVATKASEAASASADSGAPSAFPGTPREEAVAKIWKTYLGCQEISLDADFESLGGHSLVAAQILPLLRELSPRLKVSDIFAAPTIRKLAALMDARDSGGALPEVDLAADVVLDPAIRAAGLEPVRDGPMSAVLLTGGTGFLGTFLLSELLTQTDATVYCLVRAKDPADGERRLRERLQAFRLPAPGQGRLVAVPGDLQKPRLGVSAIEFEELGKRLDAIYHCGANVNFARPYSVIKAANVGGTEEVLRLATRHRLKNVHFVSTLFVTMGSISTGVPFIGEDDPLPPPVGHESAYTQSKWVAEGICRIAASRGVPVTVYRPGNIFGDQRTGVANPEDYFTKIIQGCVHLGSAPRRRFLSPIGTADDVARMLVALSLRPEALGQTYHLVNPQKLGWNTIFEHLRQFGYAVPSVPWNDWCDEFRRQFEVGSNNALLPLADMLANATENRDWPEFGTANAAKMRKEFGIEYPVFDYAYFERVFRYFEQIGILPSH